MRKSPQLGRGTSSKRKGGGVNNFNRTKDVQGSRSIVDFFAAETFRDGQEEALTEIEAAFQSGYRFVILDAPTGIGKSHIARAFAMKYAKCHILTVQKILQDQYTSDFSHEMYTMKGRGAYTCLRKDSDGKKVPCSKGLCRRKGGAVCVGCPYRRALGEAAASGITVHNFDSFYYQTRYAHAFKQRDLLIVDEAHNIESKFLNFVEFTISNKKSSHLTIPKLFRIDQYDEFLQLQLNSINRKLEEFNSYLEEDLNVLTSEELVERDELSELATKLSIYFAARDRGSEYVFEYNDHKVYQSIVFKPLFVGDFVVQNLLPYGKRVLMLSATILDKKLFCESIGLPSRDVAYIQVNSSFPVENRPIYTKFVGSMSYRNISQTLPEVVAMLKRILKKHPDERGIVHTVSRKVALYVKENCLDRRLTFRLDYRDVNSMMEEHKRKSNSFIVASGLKEGIDLKDDLSRVQVLLKVPFPNLGDKRVKRRKDLSAGWYGYMATLMFVQSLGRSVRSVTDKAVTYVLDSDFKFFYGINKRFIPPYIRRAIVW